MYYSTTIVVAQVYCLSCGVKAIYRTAQGTECKLREKSQCFASGEVFAHSWTVSRCEMRGKDEKTDARGNEGLRPLRCLKLTPE